VPSPSENLPAQAGTRARLRALDPNVRGMGWVSFVADLSSEIVYPLFPLFVTGVLGAPVAVLGFIEGVAEATATVLRYPFGRLSDRLGRRRPFVLLGYGLSAVGKLFIAVAGVWGVALAGRVVDRMGKGIRTAPRDALIGAGTKPGEQGLAFGLHRTMDTMGAALGPLIALACLESGMPLRWVLGLAVVPALLSVVVILLFVRERRLPPATGGLRLRLPVSPAYRWLLAGSLVFGLGNSSDMFILLKAGSVGLGSTGVILVYVLYNLVYASASLPLGGLSDRVGQFPLVIAGYLVFTVVYVGFALAGSVAAVAALFALYGLYIAATEGTSKALISRATPLAERASAIGLQATLGGVATLFASSLGGVLWSAFGPWATFAFGAACASAAAALMALGRGAVRRSLAAD
jgi:MFS family permease